MDEYIKQIIYSFLDSSKEIMAVDFKKLRYPLSALLGCLKKGRTVSDKVFSKGFSENMTFKHK